MVSEFRWRVGLVYSIIGLFRDVYICIGLSLFLHNQVNCECVKVWVITAQGKRPNILELFRILEPSKACKRAANCDSLFISNFPKTWSNANINRFCLKFTYL